MSRSRRAQCSSGVLSRRRRKDRSLCDREQRRRQFLEALEPRAMLSGVPFDTIRARLADQNITGATIITHGWQLLDSDGDSLMGLATDIRAKIDANNAGDEAWLLDYDVLS